MEIERENLKLADVELSVSDHPSGRDIEEGALEVSRQPVKSIESMSESHHLPPEMEEAILARLPIKSLLRFQAVSKSWKSIIWSPFFIKMHREEFWNPCRQTFLMCIREPSQSIEFCSTDDPKVITGAVYEASFSGIDFKPCCSCNGVVLLVGNAAPVMKSYILLNPAIGMYKEIACPYDVSLDQRVCGLCFDQDDFKIIVVSADIYFTYSWKNGTWSETKTFTYSEYNGICVKGMFYMSSLGDEVHELHLVRFDSRHDTFISLPKIEGIMIINRLFIWEGSGRLLIIMESLAAGETVETCIWELAGGSWIKHKDKFIVDYGYMNHDQEDVSVFPPGWENCLRLPCGNYVETIFFPICSSR